MKKPFSSGRHSQHRHTATSTIENWMKTKTPTILLVRQWVRVRNKCTTIEMYAEKHTEKQKSYDWNEMNTKLLSNFKLYVTLFHVLHSIFERQRRRKRGAAIWSIIQKTKVTYNWKPPSFLHTQIYDQIKQEWKSTELHTIHRNWMLLLVLVRSLLRFCTVYLNFWTAQR